VAFLPRAFLPRGFLPRGFLPRGFLPRGFLPRGFLPRGVYLLEMGSAPAKCCYVIFGFADAVAAANVFIKSVHWYMANFFSSSPGMSIRRRFSSGFLFFDSLEILNQETPDQ
jgi:hypothetical protein